MSLPSPETALNRTAADPGAPAFLRIEALAQLPYPWRTTLLKIMRDPMASSKLKALASLRYAELTQRKQELAALEEKTEIPPTNSLGLKL